MHVATRIAAATALAVVSSWLGGCAGTGTENGTTKPLATVDAPGAAANPPAAAQTSAAASSSYRMPTPADFTVKLKITELTCFGTAGCNVTAKVQLAWPPGIADPEKTWDVTYEIIGGTDGVQTGTTQVTGENYETLFTDAFLSINKRSDSKKLKARVTVVEEA